MSGHRLQCIFNSAVSARVAPDLLSSITTACLNAEGLGLPCSISLLITDDTGIRNINHLYRGMDKATDVLSFPAINYPKGKTAADCPGAILAQMDVDQRAAMLGDIIISIDRAVSQAIQYGHSLNREMGYLLAHGVFHLLGYDHIDTEDRKKMRNMEEKALVAAQPDEAVAVDTLLHMARDAMQASYSPYSHFKVGAALLASDGRIYTGCNIENASYGLTNCAERTALFKAVSEGVRSFEAIAIAAEKSAPWPCGACRQALSEFCADLPVYVTWGEAQQAESTLAALLPHSFSPASGIQSVLGKESYA